MGQEAVAGAFRSQRRKFYCLLLCILGTGHVATKKEKENGSKEPGGGSQECILWIIGVSV